MINIPWHKGAANRSRATHKTAIPYEYSAFSRLNWRRKCDPNIELKKKENKWNFMSKHTRPHHLSGRQHRSVIIDDSSVEYALFAQFIFIESIKGMLKFCKQFIFFCINSARTHVTKMIHTYWLGGGGGGSAWAQFERSPHSLSMNHRK